MCSLKAREQRMKNIMTIVVLAALAAGMAWAIGYGENKQEVVDCLTWQQQAKDYPAFYLTSWQKKQCDAHHITVNAPVK